jgi:uncharacterized protein YlbG (UPF0298 family)
MMNEVMNYIDHKHRKNLHECAFSETLSVLLDFVQKSQDALMNKEKKVAWVCDAVMGVGKTTAIEVLLKMLIDSKERIPLLLVFNEINLMERVYKNIEEYVKAKNQRHVIAYVTTENVNQVSQSLIDYQFVCITHQRFRDLTLGYGNWNEYRIYNPSPESNFSKDQERLIIVDEMPILFDDCVFDISSENNSVDWFDKIAEDSELTSSEKQFARTVIMMLVAIEMLDSEGKRTVTKPLLANKLSEDMQERFEQIFKKINLENKDYETVRKYKWFKRLLKEEHVGAIDRHSKGTSILCSERIPYHKRGNILILDGTAYWNRSVYGDIYEYKHVPNPHRYDERVSLHIRDINTSKSARESSKLEVHGKIASDIKILRQDYSLNIFPLCSKSDISKYIENGVITPEQRQFYEVSENGEEETLPLNLLNTKGKLALKDYRALALLNLPIRNPQYYKLISIALYGTDINLRMFERRQTEDDIKWFVNRRVQQIYEDNLIADLLQIIHRCQLRNINAESSVDIFFYTHLHGWVDLLKEKLGLTGDVEYEMVDDKYHFIKKCHYYAEVTRNYCIEKADAFNNPQHSAGKIIKGETMKNWFKTNWDNGYKTRKIREIFDSYGIEIVETKKNGTIWREFKLKDTEHEKLLW